MNYTLNKTDGSAKIDFEIDAAEWADALDKAYQENRKKFNIPGFRKGHAPKSVVIRTYGEGVLYDDAFNYAFNKAYGEILDKEKGLEPMTEPDVSIDSVGAEGVKFSATVATRPSVTLGKYMGIELEHAAAVVTEADIDAEVSNAAKRAARKVAVTDRPAKMGDIANIDFSGSVDGIPFDGGTAESHDLELGSGQFIPGFEDQVVGLNVGESRDITVTFPTDYGSEDLAGKAAVFAVKLNALTERQIPETDDAFVKDVSRFDTMQEYRADIKTRLQNVAEKRAKDTDENNLLKAIVDSSEVNLPEKMIEQQQDNLVKEFAMRLQYQGMKLEDYYKHTNTTEKDLRDARREEAKEGVKTRLVMEAVIEAEGIKIGSDEVEAKVAELAAMSGKDVAEYRKGMSREHLSYLSSDLVMDKLLKIVSGNANWSDAKPAPTTAE